MDIPQSKWARGSRLLRLAADVAVKEVGARLPGKALEAAQKLNLRIEQTRLLVETLSQMKGAAMKAGQLLGLEGNDLLPPEVVEVLSRLQSDGDPLPTAEIETLIRNAWGPERYQELKNLSPTPLASASIGQVHTADWRDRKLAIKVQFPGVSQTIDSDVALLKNVVEKLIFVTRKKTELGALFEEIRQTLHQETDYLAEARFMQQYRENFQSFDGYLIPAPVMELCTPGVLAMDYQPGQKLKDWVKYASMEEKQLLGERMMSLFLHEYLACGLVQTDPNWGNFLVAPTGELVVLDFGACKTYSKEFRTTYRKVLSHSMHRQKSELIAVSQGFGLIDPREETEAQEAYLHMMDVVIAPFRHVGVFDFATETYSQNSKDASLAFAKALKFSPPPRDLIFLHRKLGGVFQTLKRMETKLDLRLVWEKMMQE